MTGLWIKPRKLTFLSPEIEELIKGSVCTQTSPVVYSSEKSNNYCGCRKPKCIALEPLRTRQPAGDGFSAVASLQGGRLFFHVFIHSLIVEIWTKGGRVCTRQPEDKGKIKKKGMENEAAESNRRPDPVPLGSPVIAITAELSTVPTSEDAPPATGCCCLMTGI